MRCEEISIARDEEEVAARLHPSHGPDGGNKSNGDGREIQEASSADSKCSRHDGGWPITLRMGDGRC